MKNEEFCYQNEKNIPGEMDWIEIDLLIIPAKDEKRTACTKDFQRVEVSRKKTREMAEKWDWALCQTISVAEIQGKFQRMNLRSSFLSHSLSISRSLSRARALSLTLRSCFALSRSLAPALSPLQCIGICTKTLLGTSCMKEKRPTWMIGTSKSTPSI